METLKTCIKCNIKKPVNCFSIQRKKYNSYHRKCKDCRKEEALEYRNRTFPERQKKWKERYKKKISDPIYKKQLQRKHKNIHLKKEYGITLEEYEKMLEKQGGVCAICGKKETHNKRKQNLSIDHNHKTNEIRALLCYKCNLAIGYVSENICILKKMISYLQKYNLFQDL